MLKFSEFIKRIEEKKGLRAFYFFCNKFNKFNNTRARMLDSKGC